MKKKMSKDCKERYVIAVFLRIIMLKVALASSLDMLNLSYENSISKLNTVL